VKPEPKARKGTPPERVIKHTRGNGTLTHNIADCSVDGVWAAGTPVTEPSGPDHVHIGRNLGPGPVVLWVDYIQPAGTPLSVEVADPGCGFA
jgi:hypothetical protein